MAEVQQTSDATFRLYDWDRCDALGNRRQLHVEESLRCIDWDRGPVAPVRAESWTTLVAGSPSAWPREQRSLARCRFFELEYVSRTDPVDLGGTGRLQLLVVLAGRGRLRTPHGDEALAAGQVWVLPAAVARAECRPDGGVSYLLCRLPQ